MMKKADLIIIGAQKAGTTSINTYLSQHHRIYTHLSLEYGLFRDNETFENGFEYYYEHTVSNKEKKDKNKDHFVAKMVGLMYNREMLLKLKEHKPDVKIIIVLRNPVNRAYSAFEYCHANGQEPYTNFDDAIFKNDPDRFKGNERFMRNCAYITRSNYLEHLKMVYSIFPHENIKVFLFEEMIKNMNLFLNEMCSFINISSFNFNTDIQYNESRESRMQSLSKLLAPSKNDFFLNKLIPLKARLFIKKLMKNIILKEKKKEEKIPMNEKTRTYLTDMFKKEIPELQELTKLPLQKYWSEFFNEKNK